MLVEPATDAFAWWHQVRPDTRAMIARMTVPLTCPAGPEKNSTRFLTGHPIQPREVPQ